MLRPFYRYITILSENSEEATTLSLAEAMESEKEEASGLDLRTLRAIRVLRPLKLVSGVPSKFSLVTLVFQPWVQGINLLVVQAVFSNEGTKITSETHFHTFKIFETSLMNSFHRSIFSLIDFVDSS